MYIYSPTIHQPAYVYLEDTFESMEKIIKIETKQSVKIAHFYDLSDKETSLTLKYFYETHLSGDIDFKEFKQFCNDSWTKKHGYVIIYSWDDAYRERF